MFQNLYCDGLVDIFHLLYRVASDLASIPEVDEKQQVKELVASFTDKKAADKKYYYFLNPLSIAFAFIVCLM